MKKYGRAIFQQTAGCVGWVERSETQQSPPGRGCRLGIEIEIQIEIVIRRRVGQFDFDTDFDVDDD
jgi:hypothetical protein